MRNKKINKIINYLLGLHPQAGKEKRKKKIRSIIKSVIVILVNFLLYTSCLFLLIMFPEYYFVIIVSGLALFSANCFIPDEILWKIEFKKRSEKY